MGKRDLRTMQEMQKLVPFSLPASASSSIAYIVDTCASRPSR